MFTLDIPGIASASPPTTMFNHNDKVTYIIAPVVMPGIAYSIKKIFVRSAYIIYNQKLDYCKNLIKSFSILIGLLIILVITGYYWTKPQMSYSVSLCDRGVSNIRIKQLIQTNINDNPLNLKPYFKGDGRRIPTFQTKTYNRLKKSQVKIRTFLSPSCKHRKHNISDS